MPQSPLAAAVATKLNSGGANVPSFMTLDADGADLPSDWYLRLGDEITRMFHGQIRPAPQLPANAGPHRAVVERH